jgi:hypothetical protein
MTIFYNDGSKIPAAPYKDPDSVMDYGADYSSWLSTGETISASAWLIDGTVVSATDTVNGLTLNSATSTTTATAAWLSGGTVGTTYTLTNRITTSAGRTEDRSMLILCAEK